MGADLYLKSIFDPFIEEVEPELSRKLLDQCSSEGFESVAKKYYDHMRASGGYFRNAYNETDVMWAIGLSWWGTVSPMLDEEGRLPIDRARDLLTMIEACQATSGIDPIAT